MDPEEEEDEDEDFEDEEEEDIGEVVKESPALVLDVCVSAITCLKSEDQIGYAVTRSLELLTASGEDTFAKGVDSKKRSKFFIDALKVFKGTSNRYTRVLIVLTTCNLANIFDHMFLQAPEITSNSPVTSMH